jgi:two-component system, chemotaxis family, CheB/CheR fusion protein
MVNEKEPAKRRKAAGSDGDKVVSPAPAATTGDEPSLAFPVVGIGASAGGIAALEAFFNAMSAHDPCGMAFVVIQHLAPDHRSLLVDLVRRCTPMDVAEAVDGVRVEPNHVYVIPPNHDLTLAGGVLHVTLRDEHQHRPHLVIDRFFGSLAAAQYERAICIVLSGTGSDGTMGLRDVKAEGGLVVAQAPETTEYDGMPRSAIATGMVDFVLAPAEMPAQLVAYVNHAFGPQKKTAAAPQREEVLRKICMLLNAQTGHDFSQYKQTTLVRRLERRMAMHQLGRPEDYLRHSRENPTEVQALFRDLLIGVTNFFRDPEAFKLLEDHVIARVIAAKQSSETVRVWVCGCSTGEEAYSIAILLYEHMMASRKALRIQIFATDIDRRAIDQARSGVYPASIAAHVSEERLARFFLHDLERGTYRVQPHIRDLVVFSEQDVIRDPPFSRLDLVSCRNLLIYLNVELQRRLVPVFHYALLPGGALFLGTSETLGEMARLFNVVDRKWKIFTRLPGGDVHQRPDMPGYVPAVSGAGARRAIRASGDAADEAGKLRRLTEKALLSHRAQAAVLVDSRGQILHIIGRTGKYLEPADGDASMNILTMAREGLRRDLTLALHRAVAQKELVVCKGLGVNGHGESLRVDLAVRPVEADFTPMLYLVVIEDVTISFETAAPAPEGVDQFGHVAELERELRAKDEYLQSTLEEMETTNEELKSTNEELQSVNEELQSTNEELETSKEELQSVNEELSTVNAELQDKVTEFGRANNDMNNLLAGIGVGTVFVDHQLRITRFTPAATQVINFIPSDVGRPLEHVATNLVGYDHMLDDIRSVLDNLAAKDAEVQLKSGAWFLMRIRPYRTTENLIEGAVVTLIDISERKKAEESLRRSEARLKVFVNQAYAGVSETDLEGRLVFVNDWLCQALGYSREVLLGKRLEELTEPEDLPALHEHLTALQNGSSELQGERRWLRAVGRPLRTIERISTLRESGGQPSSLLWLSIDLVDGAPGGQPGERQER